MQGWLWRGVGTDAGVRRGGGNRPDGRQLRPPLPPVPRGPVLPAGGGHGPHQPGAGGGRAAPI